MSTTHPPPSPPTTQQLKTLHQRLLAADHSYKQQRTTLHHIHILHCQRQYYAALLRSLRTRYPHPITATKFAQALYGRARANRAREKANQQWQELALHQLRRAHQTLLRARTQQDLLNIQEPATPTRYKRHDPTQLIRVRTTHPITGRATYTLKTRAQLAEEKRQRRQERY